MYVLIPSGIYMKNNKKKSTPIEQQFCGVGKKRAK
jgi:hypothetical protein